MSFNIPNTFVAGTKARADEVNENFTSIQDELNKYNLMLTGVNEDITYIKEDMFSDIITEAETISRGQKSKFSINYGNLAEDNKSPDILAFEGAALSFKVGGEYPILIITNAYGESETFENIDGFSVSGFADGVYNVFVSLSGEVELFKSSIYRQPKEPTGVIVNDVWLKTLEPWSCYKYTGTSWVDYDSVPLGSVTVLDGEITSAVNLGFNTQYLDSDCLFLTQTGRGNLSKRFETDWFAVTPSGAYTFEHNLNIDPVKYRARLIAKVTENYGGYEEGDIIETLYSNYSGNEANVEIGCIIIYGKNSIKLGVGDSTYHCCNTFNTFQTNYLPKSKLLYKLILTEDIN